MTRLSTSSIFLVLILFLTFRYFGNSTPKMAHGTNRLVERLRALSPVINEIASVTGAPSISLGISHHGEVIHRANFGYRDVEKQMPPDSDTLYGIGSITKMFTASIIASLVEQGMLEWQTPLLKILPELETVDDFITQELTAVDLLSHRTALAASTHWWYGADGVLLLDKDQTIPFFNRLKRIGPFRAQYDYNNWNYAVLGEIVEKLSGKSFESNLALTITHPLQMHRTSSVHKFEDADNVAFPYAVLDDRSAHRLPKPSSQDGQIMAAAQAIQSSVNDLLIFTQAYLTSYRDEIGGNVSSSSPLKNTVKLMTGHTPRGSPSMLEKTYALGAYRNQLPSSFEGLGCNSMFVKQMPTIAPGGDSRLVIQHGGSLAGYTTFLTLLPEIDSSIVVLVNSIGLGDPASWVNQLLIEALVDSPTLHDWVELAREAASNHVGLVPRIQKLFEENRTSEAPSKPLSDYVGRYKDPTQPFFIDVRLKGDSTLEIFIQGLASQAWDLKHHKKDVFSSLTPRDYQAKRAIFTFMPAAFYTFTFRVDDSGKVDRLYWAHDFNVPPEQQFFDRDNEYSFGEQRPSL